MTTRSATIYHIAECDAWHHADESYTPSSMKADGFIHCSLWSQLAGVARKIFPGRTDLVVLEIDVTQVPAPVVYEDLYASGEEYPHIYGGLPRSSVVSELVLEWPHPEHPALRRLDAVPELAIGPLRTVDLTIRHVSGDTGQAEAFVLNGLKSFNDSVSPYHRAARAPGAVNRLAVMLADRNDRWLGGITGAVHWGWLEVEDFWLPERCRNAGWGRRMLLELERAGAELGATRAQLSTFSFQARGLYEKLGYHVVGELEDYPPGESFYWMRKDGIG